MGLCSWVLFAAWSRLLHFWLRTGPAAPLAHSSVVRHQKYPGGRQEENLRKSAHLSLPALVWSSLASPGRSLGFLAA